MDQTRSELSCSLPRGWSAKESWTLVAPDHRANVILSTEPLDPGVDAVQYARGHGELLVREFPGFQESAQGELSLPSGQLAQWRQFSWRPSDGVPLGQLQIYAVVPGRGYTGTATTPLGAWPWYEPAFHEVFRSLHIGSRDGRRATGVDHAPTAVDPTDAFAARFTSLTANPADIRNRLDLVADLVAASRHVEAFALLSDGYSQATSGDRAAAVEMRHALQALATRMRTEAERTASDTHPRADQVPPGPPSPPPTPAPTLPTPPPDLPPPAAAPLSSHDRRSEGLDVELENPT